MYWVKKKAMGKKSHGWKTKYTPWFNCLSSHFKQQ